MALPEGWEAQVRPRSGLAGKQGITVITHEAASQKNTLYDIEAFKNEDFGPNLMDRIAACMGEEGEYAVFVGSLGSQTHNQWVDGAIARQQEAYPNMTLVGDKNATADDQQQAYAKAQEVLRAFPNIKGLQGSASTDVAGIGLAIEERGLDDPTCDYGTSACEGIEVCDVVSDACLATCTGCSINFTCYGNLQVNNTNPCLHCDVGAATELVGN